MRFFKKLLVSKRQQHTKEMIERTMKMLQESGQIKIERKHLTKTRKQNRSDRSIIDVLGSIYKPNKNKNRF